MRYEPIENRVLIKVVQRPGVEAKGIWVPDLGESKPQIGEVLAVGIGRVTQNGVFVPCRLKQGDLVLFSKYGGVEVSHDFSEYLIFMRESDVFAKVLEDEDETESE